MFNQLSPSDVVRAVGVTARDAARGGDVQSGFSRDQLMSAYSATRHLAAELSTYEPEWAHFRAALAARVREDADAGLGPFASRLEADGDVAAVAAATAELLERLRDDATPTGIALRADVRRLVRELADREVDLLADALS